jgi:hypothetical protein
VSLPLEKTRIVIPTHKKISRFLVIARFCHRIVPFWNLRYPKVLLRACRICRQRRFEPYEAFRLGLFQPTFADSQLDNYTSRKHTTKLQKAVNPESWSPLLKDKGLFYRYLMAVGLPMPQLYAIFFQKVPGWSPDGAILADRDDWQHLFESILPPEFVIKPCRGAFGAAVKIFKRTPYGFEDATGNKLDAAGIYGLMRSDSRFDSFVIQQRLRNHPEINRLNPSEFLQTVRVTTFIDRKGNCHIIFAFFKLIRNQNITDNFHDGLSGNMLASVCVDRGRLEPAVVATLDGRGATYFHKHPQNGLEFEKFEIPFWSDITTLAQKAATRFLPLRTIGWDIAISPEGPKIVEGNIWWNPLNRQGKWKSVIEVELSYDL